MNKLTCLAILALFGLSSCNQHTCTDELKNTSDCSTVKEQDVCASNGFSYINPCHACKEDGVTGYDEGACTNKKWGCTKDVLTQNDCSTFSNFEVCAKELAYTNVCHACKEGHSHYEEGACPNSKKWGCTQEMRNEKDCTTFENFEVCASNGLSYTTVCHACQEKNVNYYIEGSCANSKIWGCTNEIRAEKDCNNFEEFIVCGNNGLNYNNVCHACSEQGVSSYAEGGCPNHQRWGCTKEIRAEKDCNTFSNFQCCGNDGHLYNNVCQACHTKFVFYYVAGACKKAHP